MENDYFVHAKDIGVIANGDTFDSKVLSCYHRSDNPGLPSTSSVNDEDCWFTFTTPSSGGFIGQSLSIDSINTDELENPQIRIYSDYDTEINETSVITTSSQQRREYTGVNKWTTNTQYWVWVSNLNTSSPGGEFRFTFQWY